MPEPDDQPHSRSGFGTVLVVCTANVCRSPLAARLLANGLRSDRVLRVDVTSAGTRALVGAPMCTVSGAALGPADESYAADHRARALTPDLVRDADLVLTLERDHRSSAVQLAPGSQSKVFTLREASGLLAVLVGRQARSVSDIPGLARAMHSVRGLAPMEPATTPRRWWQRPVEPEDPMTIVDGHGLDLAAHTAAAEQVSSTTGDVVRSILELARRSTD